MGFESVRGYVQLASGLGELTRARAVEAAQGMLSLPGVGVVGVKVAGQVSALADELLAAATINREHLTALVRSEVDAAVTRMGLVPADQLEESRAEAARLRKEIGELRSTSSARSTSAARSTARKTAGKESNVTKASGRSATAPTGSANAGKGSAGAGKGSGSDAAASTSGGKSAKTANRSRTAKTAKGATTTRRSTATTRSKPASS